MVKEVFRQEYETESGDIEEEILITHQDFLEGVDQASWLIMAPEAESLEYGTGAAALAMQDMYKGSKWGGKSVGWIYKGTDPVYEMFEEHVEKMEFLNGVVFYPHEGHSFVTGTSKYASATADWTEETLPPNIEVHHKEELGFETIADQLAETTLYIIQGPKVRERYWDHFGPQINRLYSEAH